jgi:erythromycin esterase
MFDVIVFFEDTSPSHLLAPQSGLNMPSPPTYPSQPGNLGFEDSTSSWVFSSDRPQDYAVGADAAILHGGAASGTIRSTAGQAAGFAALLQTCAADRYRGQRLRMSAYVKTEGVSKGAGVLVRVDSASSVLAIRNMQDRPILGTTDWTRYDIVLDVPDDGSNIAFGAWIQGTGQVWLDDFQLEAVGTDVPLTP